MKLATPQADLFDTASQFKRAGTSSDAAEKAAEKARLGDTHRLIWGSLIEFEHHHPGQGLTPDEIAQREDLCLNTARARMSELRKQGWIKPTGEVRKTAAGRNAEVYRAVRKDGKNP